MASQDWVWYKRHVDQSMSRKDINRFEALVVWVQKQGGSLHPRVQIYNDPTTGFSFRISPDSNDSEASQSSGDGLIHFDSANPIVSCPSSATLSMFNTLDDGPFQFTNRGGGVSKPPRSFGERFHAENPAHVVGRFFLIKQYLMSKASHWHPYIATLPQPEDRDSWALPAFWPQEDTDLLEGTNAHNAILEIQAIVSTEYAHAVQILREDGIVDASEYTRELYEWAYCIFTSRSFRPSLVVSQQTKRELLAKLGPDEQVDVDECPMLLPLFDVGNHSMLAGRTKWDVKSDPKRVAFVSGDAYKPGEQIFNNYGGKTNSELLLAYGFIIPETEGLHNDYVHFRKKGAFGKNPLEFLVSLRPLDDPSSVAARIRRAAVELWIEDPRPEFKCVEAALLWDLGVALATEEEKETLDHPVGDYSGEAISAALTAVFGNASLSVFADLRERVQEMLLNKLAMDYTKFLENDIEVSPEDVPDLTKNQRLALQYRSQYGKVFRNAITALGGEFAEDS